MFKKGFKQIWAGKGGDKKEKWSNDSQEYVSHRGLLESSVNIGNNKDLNSFSINSSVGGSSGPLVHANFPNGEPSFTTSDSVPCLISQSVGLKSSDLPLFPTGTSGFGTGLGSFGASDSVTFAKQRSQLGRLSHLSLSSQPSCLEKGKAQAEEMEDTLLSPKEDKSVEGGPLSPPGALYTEARLVEHAREWEATGAKSVPPDFICPLSLDIMVDPVVIASGQTYERAYIERWLAGGHKTCPKTNQELPNINVVPNEAAKAVIREWCETHGIVLPDKVDVREDAVARAVAATKSRRDAQIDGSSQGGHLISRRNQYRGLRVEGFRLQMERQLPSLRSHTSSASLSPCSPATAVAAVLESAGELGCQRHTEEGERERERERERGSFEALGVVTEIMDDAEGLAQGLMTSTSLYGEGGGVSVVGHPTAEDSNSSKARRKASKTPKEEHVNEKEIIGLIERAESESEEEKRRVAEGLRKISKVSRIARVMLSELGSVPILVELMNSLDDETAEHAVTALLNLSLESDLRPSIAAQKAVVPLVHLIESAESMPLRDNALTALCNLSSMVSVREEIRTSGVISLLLDIVGSDELLPVRQEATICLFNLSLNSSCRADVVSCGGVELVLELLAEQDVELEEELAMFLFALLKSPLGRSKVQLLEGVPLLASIVESGEEAAQVHAVAALLLIASGSDMGREMVRSELTIASLVAISEGANARGKAKAVALLKIIRGK